MKKLLIFLITFVLIFEAYAQDNKVSTETIIKELQERVLVLENLVHSNKCGFATPDYQSFSHIVIDINGKEFSIPEDGFLQLEYMPGETRIYINESQLAPAISVYNDAISIGISPVFPVKKGDKIKISSSKAVGQANGTLYKIRQ